MTIKKVSIPDIPKRDGAEFDKAIKERLTVAVPIELPIYTAQVLQSMTPSVYPHHIVACSNGDAGGECVAYCNGRAWFVVALGNRIAMS